MNRYGKYSQIHFPRFSACASPHLNYQSNAEQMPYLHQSKWQLCPAPCYFTQIMIFIPSYHFTINSQICKLDCNTHCTVKIRNCNVSPWLGAPDQWKEWPSARVFKQYRACRWIILYNSNFIMRRFSIPVLKCSELHLIVCQGLFQ